MSFYPIVSVLIDVCRFVDNTLAMNGENNTGAYCIPQCSDRLVQGGSPSSDSQPDDSQLEAIATRMAREIILKDRVYRMKEYKCCFKGTDAVKWMLSNEVCPSPEEAVRLGNQLREQGFIRHVANAHTFDNKEHYYWFHESIMDRTCECQPSSSYASMLGWRGTATAGDHDVGNELIQVQRTVHAIKSEMQTKITDTRREVAVLSQELNAFERRLKREMNEQEWWLSLMFAGLGATLLFVDFPRANWLMHTAAVMLIFHALMTMQKTSHQRKALSQGTLTVNTIATSPPSSEHSTEDRTDASSSPEEGTGVRLSLEDFVEWPDSPCLWYAHPCLLHGSARHLRINSDCPITFETDLFKGEACLWIDGLRSTPPNLFEGKKRKSCFAVRGRFKEALSFDEVLTGQQFVRPLRDIPAEFLLKALLKMAKSLNPSSKHQLTPFPEFLSSLISTAQVVNVSEPGTEPHISEPIEDMRAVHVQFVNETGEPLCSLARKKLMHQHALRAPLRYDTDHVWTFYFWQHLLDLSTYQLDMTIKRFNLLHHLDGQPLLLMAQHSNGPSIWKFEIWHRDLLRSHPTDL